MSLSLDGEESTLELEEVANDKVRPKSGMTKLTKIFSVMKLNNSLISVDKTDQVLFYFADPQDRKSVV